MSTFQRCPQEILDLARDVMCSYPEHKPLLDARVKIDFVFAFAADDGSGKPPTPALSKNGVRALGIARKIPLKDRAMGRGDAEIALDGDWWHEASPGEQRALLDHELYHIAWKTGRTDDLGRPVIYLRKHDYEFGWFEVVAARHKGESMERIQARRMMENSGQFFWPEIKGEPALSDTTVTLKSGGEEVTMTGEQFSQVAKNIARSKKVN